MEALTNQPERRTTTDLLFDHLHEDIVSLKLLPGSKLSETEVAQRFGVSRQPVRDAFNRLSNLDLLLVRPQKATVVRGFSMERIAHARFLRLAIELEVVRSASIVWDDKRAAVLQENIDQQRGSIEDGKDDEFHVLDFRFHALLCELGDHSMAADVIAECRQKTDRLCVLSFSRPAEATTLIDEHCELAAALANHDAARAAEITRHHLGRLDAVIDEIHASHAEYFE